MKIRQTIQNIVEQAAHRTVNCTGEIFLSSIEILTVVSEIERQFKIAMEDSKIFREIFTSYEALFDYVEKMVRQGDADR